MNHEKIQVPHLRGGETGYKLTDGPAAGSLVAVAFAEPTEIYDGYGHYLALHHRVSARWVNEKGEPERSPSGHEITGTHTHNAAPVNGAGVPNTVTREDIIAELLDGMDGTPSPFLSPIRRAIVAFQAHRAMALAAPRKTTQKSAKK